MTRALLVALVLAAGCGGDPSPATPEPTWAMSADWTLTCGPGVSRYIDGRPYDQWCIWDCVTYQGVPNQRVAVRWTITSLAGQPETWAEHVYVEPGGSLCR